MNTPCAARRRVRMAVAWSRWDFHAGRHVGWAQGYRAGYAAGAEVGAAGTLIAIQHALPAGILLDLLPKLPHASEYRRLQQLRALSDGPCSRRCGACALCARAAAVAGNLARYGTTEYPGGPVGWTAPATADRLHARTVGVR
jgi:hypothetical protein